MKSRSVSSAGERPPHHLCRRPHEMSARGRRRQVPAQTLTGRNKPGGAAGQAPDCNSNVVESHAGSLGDGKPAPLANPIVTFLRRLIRAVAPAVRGRGFSPLFSSFSSSERAGVPKYVGPHFSETKHPRVGMVPARGTWAGSANHVPGMFCPTPSGDSPLPEGFSRR